MKLRPLPAAGCSGLLGRLLALGFVYVLVLLVVSCSQPAPTSANSSASSASSPSPQSSDSAPPPEKTAGFDGNRAFEHVRQLVSIGPRIPATEGIRRAQDYIRTQLTSSGCTVTEDSFTGRTPKGNVALKNLLVKIPGKSDGILLLLTHYDTTDSLRIPNFLGANDSGSSTGLLLELARLLCNKQHPLAIWLAFLDGEEAFVQWSETDSTYGSRQLAAQMALSGDLKRTRAVLLADMVGYRELKFRRDANSTPWLTDLVWSTAKRLGYANIFVDDQTYVDDDHMPFIRRDVPAVDIIQLEDFPDWHRATDTLDKISPRSLAITGHVFLESLNALFARPR